MSHERDALSGRVRAVQRHLRQSQLLRRGLLVAGAVLLVLVVGDVMRVAGAGARLPAWATWPVALLAAAAAWWRTRTPHLDLARTALWVEEQRRAPLPDFALTTAVEFAASGEPVPVSLASAALQTLQGAPVASALGIARRRALLGPALFVTTCAALLLWRPGTLKEVVHPVAAVSATSASADSSGAIAPLDAWDVRVLPPGYAALPARTLGNVSAATAIVGSTILVSGDGPAPTASVERMDAGTTVQPTVRETDGTWRVQTLVTGGAQTMRASRGGRTRLLVIEGRNDSIPRVSLDAPLRDSVFREPRGLLPLRATAHDDIGLTKAHFELIVTSGEGERFTVRTVLMAAQQWAGGAGVRNATLRGQLDLTSLQLQAGDVIHLRAVARDAHPASDREFGSSETRAFRIARPAEYDSVAVEPAPPPEVDKSLLSQRMLLMLTEKLDKARPRMARADVLRESSRLARDQARLRLAVGDVVFQRLSGESSAEHAHYAGDGHEHGVDQQGGKLSMSASSTTGMLEEGNDSPVVAINQPLLEAYNAMWDAGRALEQGDPHAAIPPMKRALEAIERSRAASRIYLRGKPPAVILDIAKVRLTGKDTGQATVRSRRVTLSRREALRDARLVQAALLATRDVNAARDSVALLRAEALSDAPAFAAALATLLDALDRGGVLTDDFVRARRVLGNVVRTPASSWSWGVQP